MGILLRKVHFHFGCLLSRCEIVYSLLDYFILKGLEVVYHIDVHRFLSIVNLFVHVCISTILKFCCAFTHKFLTVVLSHDFNMIQNTRLLNKQACTCTKESTNY